jgi:hypothetical protein
MIFGWPTFKLFVANVDDPSTQRNENRNNPTERESINLLLQSLSYVLILYHSAHRNLEAPRSNVIACLVFNLTSKVYRNFSKEHQQCYQ